MDDVPAGPAETPNTSCALLRSIRLDGVDKKTQIHIDGRFVLVVPSPDGEWLAIQNRYDAYLAAFPKVGDSTVNINFKAPEVPLRRLTKEGANYIYWADGGKTLTWSFGNDFYRVKRDDVLNAAKPEKDKPENWKPETFAISLQVPRDTPQGLLFLRGARIVTMKGEEMIEQGDILIENNRIKAIGAFGKQSKLRPTQSRSM